MSTYLDLQNRIIRRLKSRSDLLADVKAEIQSRISYYQGESFVAAEGEDTSITTLNGVSIYPLPASILQVTGAWVLYAGALWSPLEPKPIEWINTVDDVIPAILSIPDTYSIFDNQLRLYPTPFGAWTIKLDGLMTIPTLVNDSDSNFWTNDGEALIRYAVIEELASQLIGMSELAAQSAMLKEKEYENLIQKASNLSATGMIQGHWS